MGRAVSPPPPPCVPTLQASGNKGRTGRSTTASNDSVCVSATITPPPPPPPPGPDLNECRVRSLCQHACRNTEGSYQCLCPAGYRLLPSGKNCQGERRPCQFWAGQDGASWEGEEGLPLLLKHRTLGWGRERRSEHPKGPQPVWKPHSEAGTKRLRGQASKAALEADHSAAGQCPWAAHFTSLSLCLLVKWG